MRRYFSSPIAIGIIVVTLVSAAYSFYYHDRPRVDAQAYDRIGWNLARGLGYIEVEANAENPRADDAIVRVGPGYQFFLAGIYALFGHHIWIVWILQAILRGATAYLVYKLAQLLFSHGLVSLWQDRAALIAAALFGFSPDLIVVNGFLLTETLFLFLLMAAVYGSIRLLDDSAENTQKGMIYATGIGLLWAFAILTRPVAILAFAVVVFMLGYHKEFKQAAAVLLAPLLLVGAWSAFVTARYDHFVLTTTAGWYDMWVGNNPQATGGFEKSPEIQAFRDITHDSTVLDEIGREKYFEFLATQPLQFFELQWRKTALYFSLMRPGGYWIHIIDHPWDLRITLGSSLVWTFLLFAGGLSGAWLFWRRRKDNASRAFLAFAILQPLAVIPIIVETRYRYALFPFLVIFAAYFVMLFFSGGWHASKENGLRKAFATILIFLGICAGYDFWYNFGDIISKLDRVI